jgi:hypothetical protein
MTSLLRIPLTAVDSQVTIQDPGFLNKFCQETLLVPLRIKTNHLEVFYRSQSPLLLPHNKRHAWLGLDLLTEATTSIRHHWPME